MNRRPSGWNLTALTPNPVGAVIVIVVGLSSAPGGMTSECGPARRTPPSGPIVWVSEAYGRLEHLSNPVAPRRPPMRLASGAGTAGTDVGVRSVHASATTSNITDAIRRRAFMIVPLFRRSEGDFTGVQHGTITGSVSVRKVTLRILGTDSVPNWAPLRSCTRRSIVPADA